MQAAICWFAVAGNYAKFMFLVNMQKKVYE